MGYFIVGASIIFIVLVLYIIRKLIIHSTEKIHSLSKSAEYEAKIMALQAQIKPHFLYNSLMAVSAAGMENGNWKVEVMCNQLGELFQYAGKEDYNSTINEEIEHIKTYLDFMKWRYLDTVEFRIEVDDRLLETRVPRLILQPIVENCFAYAFHSIHPPLVIEIKGYFDNDQWVIEVCDNGTGIDFNKMKELELLIHEVRHVIVDRNRNQQLQIGGKALVNIYARLYLWYGEGTIFQMDNYEKGFRVIIGGIN